MRKFKLIKEYPGSHKLGTTYQEIEGLCPYNGKMYKNLSKEGACLLASEIENHPEFWEEIVEKDYEILSFRNIGFENNGSFDDEAVLKNDGLYHLISSNYNIHRKETLNSMILKNNFKIHSVKRLSDGEIFTIGDKIFPNNKIYKFELKNDILKIWHCDISFSTPIIEGPSGQPGNCSWIEGINNLKKAKQPLFTTEDGVDIYESDEFYYVKFTQVNHSVGKPFQIIRGNRTTFIYEPQYEKYFSTKEAAEEYILMNKPCLSLNDINELLCKNTSSYFLEKFKKLVQQKLNK